MSALGLLASMPEDHFQCPICLDVFSDPVTTPCGHTFCNTCLSQHWDNSELCHCPTCNKRFPMRPEFSTNTVMAEISVQIKRRRVEALESIETPGRVKCGVCTEVKLNAFLSCLECMTSYCEDHLEPHQRLPGLMRHKLVDPVEDLEQRVCEKHEKFLEFFCRVERVCICLLCRETDHKDHEAVPVEDEGALQRDGLEFKKATIQLMIDHRQEKIKEFTGSSETSREKAEREIEDSDNLLNRLMNEVQDMRTKLRSNIREKLRKSQEKDAVMIEELHQEITALQRTHSELEQLSENKDHFQLLQTLQTLSTMSGTKDWSNIRVYSDLCVQTVRRAVSHIVRTFQAELKTLTNTELSRMRQYKEPVTFNPSSAGGCLVVTESGTRLKFSRYESLSSSDESERVNFPTVLGTKGFTSGRHYWEVQVGVWNNWAIGVAAATADRSGRVTVKKENGFFAIGKSGFDYQVHSAQSPVLHLCPRPRHIGVYVDYDEGRVSFYDVNEKLHIFSFSGERFTEKMFPFFCLSSKGKKSEALVIKFMPDSLFSPTPTS